MDLSGRHNRHKFLVERKERTLSQYLKGSNKSEIVKKPLIIKKMTLHWQIMMNRMHHLQSLITHQWKGIKRNWLRKEKPPHHLDLCIDLILWAVWIFRKKTRNKIVINQKQLAVDFLYNITYIACEIIRCYILFWKIKPKKNKKRGKGSLYYKNPNTWE